MNKPTSSFRANGETIWYDCVNITAPKTCAARHEIVVQREKKHGDMFRFHRILDSF
jgi:hypothetical protein